MESDLHKALKPFNFYDLYKGWIPERFNEVSNQEFIFVHLDVDLYQPTLDSLDFFYSKLKKNGVIIVDDYDFFSTGVKTSVDEWFKINSKSFNKKIMKTKSASFAILERVY